ncbi:hypothetical protein H8B06_08480 [Sphingobacterium sp. DN00404]|uniref:Uncharacterized protein n=1 Tax=Sphingobacterium micropteri TaxID=2763501 RepID=A0ABR7YNH8_9SPHI|nr:hypothetical protein [Sphingobacterium micropteri]MBD1432857.1 hypothetical protein [Sphingobacterium micropteri]
MDTPKGGMFDANTDDNSTESYVNARKRDVVYADSNGDEANRAELKLMLRNMPLTKDKPNTKPMLFNLKSIVDAFKLNTVAIFAFAAAAVWLDILILSPVFVVNLDVEDVYLLHFGAKKDEYAKNKGVHAEFPTIFAKKINYFDKFRIEVKADAVMPNINASASGKNLFVFVTQMSVFVANVFVFTPMLRSNPNKKKPYKAASFTGHSYG